MIFPHTPELVQRNDPRLEERNELGPLFLSENVDGGVGGIDPALELPVFARGFGFPCPLLVQAAVEDGFQFFELFIEQRPQVRVCLCHHDPDKGLPIVGMHSKVQAAEARFVIDPVDFQPFAAWMWRQVLPEGRPECLPGTGSLFTCIHVPKVQKNCIKEEPDLSILTFNNNSFLHSALADTALFRSYKIHNNLLLWV